jgi:hypothetical protein
VRDQQHTALAGARQRREEVVADGGRRRGHTADGRTERLEIRREQRADGGEPVRVASATVDGDRALEQRTGRRFALAKRGEEPGIGLGGRGCERRLWASLT